MSQSDSFIEEVTEEVRRDRLWALARRYGWIAVLVILLIVGGTAWNEYRKAQAERAAQDLGDSIIGALEGEAPASRAVSLSDIQTEDPRGQAVLALMEAAELAASGDNEASAAALEGLATNSDVPPIYRQIASFKALLAAADTMPNAERRIAFEALAQPGNPLRVLAEEQLALMSAADGDADAAIERLTRLLEDAEATPGLRQRATQVIVALGGDVAQLLDQAGETPSQ